MSNGILPDPSPPVFAWTGVVNRVRTAVVRGWSIGRLPLLTAGGIAAGSYATSALFAPGLSVRHALGLFVLLSGVAWFAFKPRSDQFDKGFALIAAIAGLVLAIVQIPQAPPAATPNAPVSGNSTVPGEQPRRSGQQTASSTSPAQQRAAPFQQVPAETLSASRIVRVEYLPPAFQSAPPAKPVQPLEKAEPTGLTDAQFALVQSEVGRLTRLAEHRARDRNYSRAAEALEQASSMLAPHAADIRFRETAARLAGVATNSRTACELKMQTGEFPGPCPEFLLR